MSHRSPLLLLLLPLAPLLLSPGRARACSATETEQIVEVIDNSDGMQMTKRTVKCVKKVSSDPPGTLTGTVTDPTLGEVTNYPAPSSGHSTLLYGAALTGAQHTRAVTSLGAEASVTGAANLARVPGNTTAANPMATDQVYTVAVAKEKVNAEFDQMIRNNPQQTELINRARGIFMQRLAAHTETSFPASEIDMLDKMFQQQINYGREMRDVIRNSNLPPAEQARIMRAVRTGNLDAIARDGTIPENLRTQLLNVDARIGGAMVTGHSTNGTDGVMTDFHLAILASFHRPEPGTAPGATPANTNGDFIPTPPGSHSTYMQNNVGKDPGTWELSARDKLARGDSAGGMRDLDKAIGLGAGSEALLLRGGLRLEQGDYNGAAADARKALELKPGDQSALFILNATAGRTTGGSAGATASAGAPAGGSFGASEYGGFGSRGLSGVAGMTNAAVLSSAAKLEEARRAMALGDSQAAIALAQRALELNANNAAAHAFLSNVYARTGDYARAIASANAGLALAPRDAALLNSKAFAENRSKKYRDALASSNGAIEADARNPYGYANRAHAYGGLGDKDAMMSDINHAASMDPSFAKAAADASALQLPSNADILFMFPGENPAEPAAAAAAPGRGRSFGFVVGAGILGGLLLALGLLSTVLAPLKDTVVSAFTKATRVGPSVHALEEAEAAAPAGDEATAPVSGLVRGQYEIKRQIGAGGMGMVYEGTDRSLGRRVAIKKMRDELRINPRERDRFVIEAKTVASLHHPNIVDIYAIAEEGEDVYLVFEFVDGKTIHDLVQAKGRLSPADALRATQAMGEALTYAHSRGVIHRDMKPSNVMLTESGQIKVMDFGIARMAKDAMTRYSMTNNVVGTPPYMAPEQEQGVVRKESDVYSLAVCAYEMLTGKLPFIGIGAGMLMNKINMSYIPPARAIAGLPDSLDEVFLKAFQANPEQRYHSPQEFAAALETALGGAHAPSKA